jgi:hypothetical protein
MRGLDGTGHQGYKKAEVTGGGVSLEEVKWETLESGIEANRGLFICGEVLDCFGRIGGFNFYWAWCVHSSPAPLFSSNLILLWPCMSCRVSCVVCHVSCVMCRVSCVVCRVSCVVCRVSWTG